MADLSLASDQSEYSESAQTTDKCWDDETSQSSKSIDDTVFFTDESIHSDRKSFSRPSIASAQDVVGMLSDTSSCISRYKTPLLIAGLVYMLIATGCTGYFFLNDPNVDDVQESEENQLDTSIYQFESLNVELEIQVFELGVQVDMLEDQVVILGDKNEEFLLENNKLHAYNQDYARFNLELNETNNLFKELNDDLANNIANFDEQNYVLEQENESYMFLNRDLNKTINYLQVDLSGMEKANDNLNASINSIRSTNDNITRTNDELRKTNEYNNATARSLEAILDNLAIQNLHYRQINKNLAASLSFLNDTANDTYSTFENIVFDLDSKLHQGQILLLKDLQIRMESDVASWRCLFNKAFNDHYWVQNPKEYIMPTSDFYEALNYIDNIVFGKLCVDIKDFELYIQKQLSVAKYPDEMTLSSLGTFVHDYSSLVIEFYYYDLFGERGVITTNEWVKVDFSCDKLAGNQRYSYMNPPSR